MKIFWFLICLVPIFSCAPTPQNQSTGAENLQNGASEQTPGLADGFYVFDTEAFKNAQLKDDQSEFKKMKKDELDKMLKIFQPFTVELKGNTAVATFSHDVIRGKLSPLSQGGAGVRLKMEPTDGEKKSESVVLEVDGDSLVVDPQKKESDKMFFKKLVE